VQLSYAVILKYLSLYGFTGEAYTSVDAKEYRLFGYQKKLLTYKRAIAEYPQNSKHREAENGFRVGKKIILCQQDL
jgi:hypothetical protein